MGYRHKHLKPSVAGQATKQWLPNQLRSSSGLAATTQSRIEVFSFKAIFVCPLTAAMRPGTVRREVGASSHKKMASIVCGSELNPWRMADNTSLCMRTTRNHPGLSREFISEDASNCWLLVH
jgi:hypothetical protein